jgi:hypothetical protein
MVYHPISLKPQQGLAHHGPANAKLLTNLGFRGNRRVRRCAVFLNPGLKNLLELIIIIGNWTGAINLTRNFYVVFLITYKEDIIL